MRSWLGLLFCIWCAALNAQPFYGAFTQFAAPASGGGCSASASDNFNRANENPLTDAGQWVLETSEASNAQVLGNVVTNTGGTMTFAYYFSNNVVSWCTNQSSQVDIFGTSSTVAGDGCGVIVRAQVGARQYYELIANNSSSGGQFRIAERNGSSVILTNITNPTFVYSSGMTIKLAVTGGGSVGNITLTGYTNGVALASVHPSALVLNAGYPGIKEGGQSNGTEWMDNWVGSSP